METVNYDWIDCYNAFANKLLAYKNDRKTLISSIKSVYARQGIKLPTLETDNNIVDIDPFTVFGLFNKSSLTDSNRRTILSALSDKLGLDVVLPANFDGLPTVDNRNATFYPFGADRKADDIDNLWGLFEAALKYIDNKSNVIKNEFCRYFDVAINMKGNNNSKITMGLYWLSARDYLNLDKRSQWYIYETDKLPTALIDKLPKITDKISAETYLAILEGMRNYFNNSDCLFGNFVELSHNAWLYSNAVNEQAKADRLNNSTVNILGDSEESITHYWLFAPGYNANMWEQFYNDDIMAIGWSELGDLKQYKSKNEIKAKAKDIFKNTNFRNNGHALWQFANEIKVGDIIFVKQGRSKIIGRGIVESDYIFDESIGNDYKNTRKVNWINNGVWQHPSKAAVKTLTDITVYKDCVEELNALFEDEDCESVEERQKQYDKYEKQDFLNEVFMTADEYETLKSLILDKKNIILQGAPGVGKTFVAKRLAYSIMGEKDVDRVLMVQFHQSYSYEDFIMGYRPTLDGRFELKKGPFYNFCKRAEEDDKESQYFFIIDEINRGNISKIFGELFMLIEKDKREMKLPLMYGEEDFSVPENVYIIGMMNTADRSLAMLDYALRRRFAFYEFKPAFDTESFRQYRDKKANAKYVKLINAVEKINEMIEKDISLGKGFRIGHSYFCTDNTIDDRWLNSVVAYEILPLLEEYWFDDSSKITECERILKEAIQ